MMYGIKLSVKCTKSIHVYYYQTKILKPVPISPALSTRGTVHGMEAKKRYIYRSSFEGCRE